MEAIDFIQKDGKTKKQPYYVLSGDEDFLKRKVKAIITRMILDDGDTESSRTVMNGGEETPLEYSTVMNELNSVSLFGDKRLVIVDHADTFVTDYRPALEKYIKQPSENGVLILDVKSFASNTKLAKDTPEAAHIVCKSPTEYKLARWCVEWTTVAYKKELSLAAANLLVDLVTGSLGILDQELQKLADYVGERPGITPNDVDELVGRSRGASIFKAFDLLGQGKTAEFMRTITEMLDLGEDIFKIGGALSYQTRKLAKAARLMKQGAKFDDACDDVGVPKFPQARDSFRLLMKHLGWGRLEKLFDWQIEFDLGMRGNSPLPERTQLEIYLVKLARPRAA